MRSSHLLALLSGAAAVLAFPAHTDFGLHTRAEVTKCDGPDPFDDACAFGTGCFNGTCQPWTNCSPACEPPAICVNGQCYCGNGNNLACGNKCPEPDDAMNCGGCYRSCNPGQLCEQGQCVESDGCSGKCTSEQQCFDKKCYCINTDQLPCAGNTCPDTKSDVNNCGACGKACAIGESCNKGECTDTPTCPIEWPDVQKLCDGRCRNLNNDNDHCGNCNRKCKVGENCSLGECRSAGSGGCPPDQATCDGGCRNLANDNEHCGKCGNKCSAGRNCQAGACV